MDAYLDIETTGLSRYHDQITVIGIGRCPADGMDVVHLYDSTLTAIHLNESLAAVSSLYTYNGRRFDLPFINEKLGVDLENRLDHHDLMFDCWNANLMGGLKAVERILNIPRELVDIDGLEAIDLWYRYKNHGDGHALRTLLDYNKEDVVNLSRLKDKLRPGMSNQGFSQP